MAEQPQANKYTLVQALEAAVAKRGPDTLLTDTKYVGDLAERLVPGKSLYGKLADEDQKLFSKCKTSLDAFGVLTEFIALNATTIKGMNVPRAYDNLVTLYKMVMGGIKQEVPPLKDKAKRMDDLTTKLTATTFYQNTFSGVEKPTWEDALAAIENLYQSTQAQLQAGVPLIVPVAPIPQAPAAPEKEAKEETLQQGAALAAPGAEPQKPAAKPSIDEVLDQLLK